MWFSKFHIGQAQFEKVFIRVLSVDEQTSTFQTELKFHGAYVVQLSLNLLPSQGLSQASIERST